MPPATFVTTLNTNAGSPLSSTELVTLTTEHTTGLKTRAQVLRPDPAVIDEIVAMVAEAERPIVLGGRGAMWSGAKVSLESLAQESGALLATTLLGKGLFDGNPFALEIAGTFATDLGREVFAESDLVIAAAR